jgi:hypothetical protein
MVETSGTQAPLNEKQHDGRFGERFDDELDMPGVVWVTVGIAVITVVGFLVAWWVYQWRVDAAAAATPPPPPVVQRSAGAEPRRPPGPLLQASPEAELRAMRRELDARLNAYGWTDEALGLVHVPIDVAIDRVLADGLPQAEPAPPAQDGEATP